LKPVPAGQEGVFLVKPLVECRLAFGVVGNFAEVAELTLDLLGPVSPGMGKEREIWTRLLRRGSLAL
jgi:hypothetical protein